MKERPSLLTTTDPIVYHLGEPAEQVINTSLCCTYTTLENSACKVFDSYSLFDDQNILWWIQVRSATRFKDW